MASSNIPAIVIISLCRPSSSTLVYHLDSGSYRYPSAFLLRPYPVSFPAKPGTLTLSPSSFHPSTLHYRLDFLVHVKVSISATPYRLSPSRLSPSLSTGLSTPLLEHCGLLLLLFTQSSSQFQLLPFKLRLVPRLPSCHNNRPFLTCLPILRVSSFLAFIAVAVAASRLSTMSPFLPRRHLPVRPSSRFSSRVFVFVTASAFIFFTHPYHRRCRPSLLLLPHPSLLAPGTRRCCRPSLSPLIVAVLWIPCILCALTTCSDRSERDRGRGRTVMNRSRCRRVRATLLFI
jgi:hypothetical protein